MIVRAVESCILSHHGSPRAIAAGEMFDSDDELVRAHRWAFAPDNEVEQATAAPGERRNARRAGK